VSRVVLKNTELSEQRCVLENNTAHSDQYSLEQRCSLSSAFLRTTLITQFSVISFRTTLFTQFNVLVVPKNAQLSEQRCSKER
jgi:hypothetical protein